MKLFVRFCVVCAATLLAPLWSGAQLGPPPAAPTSNACPELDTTKLENSQPILDMVKQLANQIIQESKISEPPKMSSQWGPLNALILEQLPTVCEMKQGLQSARPEADSVTQSQVSAQAKTSQSNKQTGAPSNPDGGTSSVQKVGLPELLAIAVENGAVTNNVSGTTMTLSTTPYGFFTAFGKDLDTATRYQTFQWATQTAISATFNITNSSDPLTSATRKQVTQWQAKLTFRDTSIRSKVVETMYDSDASFKAARSALVADLSNSAFFGDVRHNLNGTLDLAFQSKWSVLRSVVVQPLAGDDAALTQQRTAIATQLLQVLDQDAGYQSALKRMETKIESQSGSYLDLLKKLRSDDANYRTAERAFEQKVADLPKGWNGALVFSEKFPAQVTSSSSSSSSAAFKVPHLFASSSSTYGPATPAYFVSELDTTCEPSTNPNGPRCLHNSGTFTANLNASFYPNPVASLNEGTFRGAQAGLQGEWVVGPGFTKIKQANDNSKMTLTLSANYERLQENKDQKGKRPDLAIGNIKLSIPITAGVSLPVSMTVASAGEQNNEKYVRGNFGITLDLDNLSALLKANR